MFQINRFAFSEENKGYKVNQSFDFPLELDISQHYLKNTSPSCYQDLKQETPSANSKHLKVIEGSFQTSLIEASLKAVRDFYKGKQQDQLRNRIKTDLKQIREKLISIEEQRDKFTYKLKAIINHSGGVLVGHYFSFIKIKDNWFCYNDSLVSLKTEEEVLKQAKGLLPGYFQSNCYCLFYSKGGSH